MRFKTSGRQALRDSKSKTRIMIGQDSASRLRMQFKAVEELRQRVIVFSCRGNVQLKIVHQLREWAMSFEKYNP